MPIAFPPIHSDFTGTATNPFEVKGGPQDVTVSIRDQGSNADGVYYLQHLDYTTPASPAWVNLTGSDDAITAASSGAATKTFVGLPAGVYRLNTASETGTVDIFGSSNIYTSGVVDPTA